MSSPSRVSVWWKVHPRAASNLFLYISIIKVDITVITLSRPYQCRRSEHWAPHSHKLWAEVSDVSDGMRCLWFGEWLQLIVSMVALFSRALKLGHLLFLACCSLLKQFEVVGLSWLQCFTEMFAFLRLAETESFSHFRECVHGAWKCSCVASFQLRCQWITCVF